MRRNTMSAVSLSIHGVSNITAEAGHAGDSTAWVDIQIEAEDGSTMEFTMYLREGKKQHSGAIVAAFNQLGKTLAAPDRLKVVP
jgi:hypothetical protein